MKLFHVKPCAPINCTYQLTYRHMLSLLANCKGYIRNKFTHMPLKKEVVYSVGTESRIL